MRPGTKTTHGPVRGPGVVDHRCTLLVCHMSKTSSDISDFSLKLSVSSLRYLCISYLLSAEYFSMLNDSILDFSFAAQPTNDKLDDFIATINSALQPMFMQIRKGMSEDSGQQYFALVSRTSTVTSLYTAYIWAVDIVVCWWTTCI